MGAVGRVQGATPFVRFVRRKTVITYVSRLSSLSKAGALSSSGNSAYPTTRPPPFIYLGSDFFRVQRTDEPMV